MKQEHFDPELDDLLKDLHQLLDDDTPLEELPKDEYDLDDLFGDEPLPEVRPDEPLVLPGFLTEEEKTAVVGEKPRRREIAEDQKVRFAERQRVPRHVAKLQKHQEQAYADWLYEQDHRTPSAAAQEPARKEKKRSKRAEPEIPVYEKPKKKRHGFRNFLIFLLILALLMAAAVYFLLPRQPLSAAADRREGVATVLLIGTDASGARTDALMLLTADQQAGQLSLVSIPRDTLVNGTYTVPKINSVYAANNGGTEGIEMLMTRVEQCVGFRPDGYILVRLDAFAEFVDTLGGVEFDVPMDMFYNDPTQELYIALEAGKQLLSGEEALGLVRFRSGYADADLGRVQVQRDFLAALIDQAVSPNGIAKAPLLLDVFRRNAETDLTAGHFLWLAKTALLSDLHNIETVTLPGSARNIGDGSYYVLDPASVAQTVNTYCNPLTREITTDDLQIRRN